MSEPSVPVKITCPECQGVINLEMNSPPHLMRYRCQVGHTYSLKEMIKGKEVQVENHLWTVMGLFEHLEFLYENILQETGEAQTLSDHDRQLIRERLACLAEHKKLLGGITEENTPAPLNDGD
jgi:hypothetical protein